MKHDPAQDEKRAWHPRSRAFTFLILPLVLAWAFFCSDILLWLGIISERLPPFHLIPIVPLALGLVGALLIVLSCRR